METLLDNPDKLALAGQLTTSSAIHNLGDTRISTASIDDPEDISLTSPVDIVFTSETAYDIVDSASGAVLVGGVGYLQGEPINLNGWEVSISGDAKAGDTHSIEPNVSGRGNNSNGIALVGMQTGLHVNGNESVSYTHLTLPTKA